jgi:hypothetical protein
MDIQIDLIERHVELFEKELDDEENDFIKEELERSELKIYVFFTQNHINISEIIKRIPYYYTKYYVIEGYNNVKIGELSKNIFYANKIDYRQEKYVLVKYRNECFESPRHYWMKMPGQDFFHEIVNSYVNLLNSLIELNEKDICFFNLSMNNISFDKNGMIKLKNFEKSLIKSKMNEEYIQTFIEKMDDFTMKPLEVHLLFYLFKNDMATLSMTTIEPICAYYVAKLQILDLFSQAYREKYLEECIKSLKKFINLSRKEIIKIILNQIDTWDNYSLSVIFFHIFGNIIKVFSLRGTFITKISKILLNNIHPEPSHRQSLQTTLQDYNSISKKINNLENFDVSHEKMNILQKRLFS